MGIQQVAVDEFAGFIQGLGDYDVFLVQPCGVGSRNTSFHLMPLGICFVVYVLLADVGRSTVALYFIPVSHRRDVCFSLTSREIATRSWLSNSRTAGLKKHLVIVEK